MIPRDCRPEVPEFYAERLRALAASVARLLRVGHYREDLEQEAIVHFLRLMTPRELVNPTGKAWARVRAQIEDELMRASFPESRRQDVDVYELEAVLPEREPSGHLSWLPDEPEKRAALAAECRRVSRLHGSFRRSECGRYWTTWLRLMGQQVYVPAHVNGRFQTKQDAHEARQEMLARIIWWCQDGESA